MIVHSRTDTGMVRSCNQDSVASGSFEGGVWGAVCDGMGGANGGDIASSTAVEAIRAELDGALRTDMSGSEVRQVLERAADRANTEIFEKSQHDVTMAGMGTTLVLAVVMNDTLYTAHAGDSRIYLISGESITRVTRDHSIVQELIDLGRITENEARVHPRRNIITRALGVYDHIEIDHTESGIAPEDIVLLCSDGLINCVEDDELLRMARRMPAEELCGAYIDEANRNGGQDNISALIISK